MPSYKCGYEHLGPKGSEALENNLVLADVTIGIPQCPHSSYQPAWCKALIDTGSNVSLIQTSWAKELGLILADEPPQKIQGATGDDLLPIYWAQMSIPALRWSFTICLHGSSNIKDTDKHSAVIGLNILRYCRLEMDGPTGAVTISRREERRAWYARLLVRR